MFQKGSSADSFLFLQFAAVFFVEVGIEFSLELVGETVSERG